MMQTNSNESPKNKTTAIYDHGLVEQPVILQRYDGYEDRILDTHLKADTSDGAYVYVIIRNDLSNAQKAVQAGHALIEATRNFNMNGMHPSIVLCVVKSEIKLQATMKELSSQRIKFSAFYEPDIGNQLTAIASEPLCGADRNAFKRFQLLT